MPRPRVGCCRAPRGWGATSGSCSSSARRARGRRSSATRSAPCPGFVDLGEVAPLKAAIPQLHGRRRRSAARIRAILDRRPPARARHRPAGGRADAGGRVRPSVTRSAPIRRREPCTSSATAATSSAPCSSAAGWAPGGPAPTTRSSLRRTRSFLGRAGAEPRSSSTRASRRGRPGPGGATSPRRARRRSGRSRSATSRWRSPTTRSPHTWTCLPPPPRTPRGRPHRVHRPLRRDLTPEQLADIEREAGPLLTELGYE